MILKIFFDFHAWLWLHGKLYRTPHVRYSQIVISATSMCLILRILACRHIGNKYYFSNIFYLGTSAWHIVQISALPISAHWQGVYKRLLLSKDGISEHHQKIFCSPFFWNGAQLGPWAPWPWPRVLLGPTETKIICILIPLDCVFLNFELLSRLCLEEL